MSDVVASIVEAAREGRLIIFAGAGISADGANRAPSWWQIYSEVAKELNNRFCERFPDLAAQVDLKKSIDTISTQGLADLIQATFAGPEFLRELAVVDEADPNHNHLAIAALAQDGYVRAVVATNFGTLLERSVSASGKAFTVITPGNCPHGHYETSVPLFKLHGSADAPMGMMETSTHQSKEIDGALRKAWKPLLNGADLLVVSSSGADLPYGAVCAFFNDFLSSGSRRIYWLHLPDTQPMLGKVVRDVTCIQEILPDFLHDLTHTLGQTIDCVRFSGRNAMKALELRMDA